MDDIDGIERERRRKIVEKARATLARLQAADHAQPERQGTDQSLKSEEPPGNQADNINLNREPARVDLVEFVDRHIDATLARHRRFDRDVLAGVISELRGECADALSSEVRRLNVELSELSHTVNELRNLLRAEQARTIDMPSPLGRGLH